MACTNSAQKFWIAGCSTGLLLLALILGLLWPTISLRLLLYPQLVLKENSLNYDNWIETPIPIYFEIYMFNWTNSAEYKNHSVKPHFDQMGPYVFHEKHIRTNLIWNENATVTFYQKRIWHFEPEMSNGSLSDGVTNLNAMAATVAYSSRDYTGLLRLAVSAMLTEDRAPLIITKTVNELLFEGYDDPLLDLILTLNNPGIPKPPFDRFGWFVDRNESETYDGNFTMNTGEDDIFQLGVLERWNNKTKTDLYRGDCDLVRGTTGELWPPIHKGLKGPLQVFATDVCRSVKVVHDSDFSMHGVKGYKWIADESVFDNGRKYPEMECFCSADEEQCPDLMPGVFNASSCKFGAPAFVSFPHFYLAHESYTEAIDGMNPNKEDHEFFVAMEPNTGIPLKVKAQLQINLLLDQWNNYRHFEGVPKAFIPMFWFRQLVDLTPELADQAKLAIMVPNLGVWIAYGLAGVGVILFIIGIVCAFTRWRQERDEELLS